MPCPGSDDLWGQLHECARSPQDWRPDRISVPTFLFYFSISDFLDSGAFFCDLAWGRQMR